MTSKVPVPITKLKAYNELVFHACYPSTQAGEAEGSREQSQHEKHSGTLSQKPKDWR